MTRRDPTATPIWVAAIIGTPAIATILWLAATTPSTPGPDTPHTTPISSISPTAAAPR